MLIPYLSQLLPALKASTLIATQHFVSLKDTMPKQSHHRIPATSTPKIASLRSQ